MKSLIAALTGVVLCTTALAELPPSAYEAMQTKAPECLNIEVLRVDIEPGESPTQQKITVMALISDVVRTSTDLKSGDFVTLHYTVAEQPKGWVGPGQIPILAEKEQTVAYLAKNAESGDYAPAAGTMSFRNF